MKKVMLLVGLIGMISAAHAGTFVTDNISGNEVWTPEGSPYHLTKMIYVLPGASLTLEAGTVVASFKVGPNDPIGSLAVCNGARIFVNGTKSNPVIMTSAEDVATWTGSEVVRTQNNPVDPLYPDGYVTEIVKMGNPKSGYWRPRCLEWGNLVICGDAYISASHYDDAAVTWNEDADQNPDTTGDVTTYTNSKCPSALNKKKMEGMEFEFLGDTKPLYGGGNDDYDAGSIHYLSIRYGGRVIEDTDELNGLSLGALGRETDIHHVEIMNNVDDGIELWGGTVQLSYCNIWNVGDDSLDFDEGWRGSAQYGLIVQGYSATAKQGSGVGDNCFEMDGAEDADAQPMSTVKISNFTVVGQPGTAANDGGDAGTAWRDNARVQFADCIWMDLDDHIIKFDCQDGDGANGYDGDNNDGTKNRTTAADGTLSWVEHWTTSYNTWKTGAKFNPNSCNASALEALYENYVSTDLNGMLCQITGSVFYGNNINYGEYNTLQSEGANFTGNAVAASMPIRELMRNGVPQLIWDSKQSKFLSIEPVAYIDPLPADGVTAGGFQGCNWLEGWTAVYAYNMTQTTGNNPSDTNADCSVNLEDLVNLSGSWLQ